MPVELLELTNFQNHKHTVIEFDPKLTVFVGPTDAGKSAILRALRWLVQNFPAGQEFINDDAKYCRALLTIDGHDILRRIGKANEYRLDGKKFKAFGRKVPPEIAGLLNLRDENFQEQIEGPFWLALSPGQVGKELNAIINLNVIDEVLAKLNNEARQCNTVVKLTRDSLDEAKAKRDRLAWVPDMAGRLAGLQGMRQDLAAKAKKQANLSSLVQEAARLQRSQDRLRHVKARALPMLAAGKALLAKQQEADKLASLLTLITDRKAELCDVERKLKKAQADLSRATTGQRCPICGRKMS